MNRKITKFTLALSPSMVLFLIASIFSIPFLIVNTDISSSYKFMSFLPFAFLIGILLSGRALTIINKSIVTIIIYIGYFIRMVIYPVFFCAGGYHSFFLSSVDNLCVSKAVLLLSLEWICVAIVSNLSTKRIDYYNKLQNIRIQLYNTRLFQTLILFLCVFLIIAYQTIPALKNAYLFLPSANFSKLTSLRWDSDTIVQRGTIERIIFSLFGFIWPIVRAVLPSILISRIYNKLGETKLSLFLSTICLIIPAVFLGEDNVGPLLGALLGLMVVLRLYKERAKSTIVLFLLIFGIIATILISSKLFTLQVWRGASGISSVAQLINAYFPGIDNIAFAYKINDPNKLSTLFFDLYYAIPFRETLFGLKGENLNDLFTKVISTNGQIVPWGYQIAHYFTLIISPLITAIFTKLAYKCEIIMRQTNDFWKFFINMYTCIMIVVSFSCYSFSTFIRTYINIILPILILYYFGRKNGIQLSKGSN